MAHTKGKATTTTTTTKTPTTINPYILKAKIRRATKILHHQQQHREYKIFHYERKESLESFMNIRKEEQRLQKTVTENVAKGTTTTTAKSTFQTKTTVDARIVKPFPATIILKLRTILQKFQQYLLNSPPPPSPPPPPSSTSSSSAPAPIAPPTPYNLHRVPIVQIIWLLCCLSMANNSMADCPSLCECKWKSGKESVLCLNANFTHIPAPLDTGTQVLDLTGNEITSIPHDSFAAVNLLNLQKVYLAKCRVRTIERYAFRKLINLVELDLSYNMLTVIPSQALEFIPELREIKLNGNPIQRVHNEAFAKVPQLVRLELSDCKLSVVEIRAFAGLEVSLEWLKLDGNKLSEVRSGTITSLTNLHGIELAANQWNCSCALRPLRAWMLRENIPCGVPPICHAPARLAGKSWDKIDLDEFACVPQIIATDTTAFGVEGRNVTMSCYVEGVPEPSVRWMVKNRVIANLTALGDPAAVSSPRTAAATQGRKTYVVNMLRNASNLTILTADMQDAGIYTCAAENKAGKVEASVTLAVSRRPPEPPLGVKIVILCVFTALLFVVGSSFAAICFCSLRRKRKMRLWNTVPPARSESYEKIEMTGRVGNNTTSAASGNVSKSGLSVAISGGRNHNEENGYLHTATTAFNCGSDDGGDNGGGVVILKPSGSNGKRNGDYRNIPTHCDDDGSHGYEDNEHPTNSPRTNSIKVAIQNGKSSSSSSRGRDRDGSNGSGGYHAKFSLSMDNATSSPTAKTSRWKGVTLRTSPQEVKRKLAATGASSTVPSAEGTSANNSTLEETDLHIPRLIDIGGERERGSHPDSVSTSISSQVDAAQRFGGGGYTHMGGWSITPIATTKIGSPQTKSLEYGLKSEASAFYGNDSTSDLGFGSSTKNSKLEHDLFESNYPDLLDIAKYAVAHATSSSSASNNNHYNSTAASTSTGGGGGGGLCTLPRKLRNTGKYFKNSSDSQSPLLNESSSKYGSGTLGDAGFFNELVFGRRYSAESTYSNYASSAIYTSGQRSNSFLNLVQSSSKSGQTAANLVAAMSSSSSTSTATAVGTKRNPSLPSSPVHESTYQQHQRSLSSAATPLLDFTSLTTRAGVGTASAVPSSSGGMSLSMNNNPTTTSTVAAYDYHAAQLERFLEEYRNLQDQLCKMKETCETIRKKEAPLRVGAGHAAQLADPVMFNAAMAATNSSPAANPKPTLLKNKAILPGQPPDPPPYWLHRNAMLKRLNESGQPDIFKS